MAQSLHSVMNQHSGSPGSYGGSPFYLSPRQNVSDSGVELPHTIVADLEKVLDSGIAHFELFLRPGTLTVTNNARLIPDSNSLPDGFCILNFKDASGQFQTFEINLNRGVITVARKPNRNPKTHQVSLTSFLGHSDMMPLLESLLRDANLQIPKPPKETEVSDELQAMRSKFLAVLKIPLF